MASFINSNQSIMPIKPENMNLLKMLFGSRKPALNKPVVSGSPSFKEQLINDFIPRIELMEEKERQHLHYLIDIKAPLEFIQKSQETQLHFVTRIKEYKEYAERL